MHDNEINQSMRANTKMAAASISARHAEDQVIGRAYTGRDEPRNMASQNGAISIDTITADQLRRIMAVENRMIFMREKMTGLADRLFGRRDDPCETRRSIDEDQCVLDRMSGALADLEYSAHTLESVMDRFEGLA